MTREVCSLGMVPLSEVNAMLLRQDSTVVSECVSDSLEYFMLHSTEKDVCLLSFSCLGYQIVYFFSRKDNDEMFWE